MTKEEIKKILDNTKVYVNGKSKEIQEKLFSFGYKWSSGKKVSYINKPFLFIHNDRTVTYGDDMDHFTKDEMKEITAEEILSIKLTGPSYRPFKNKEECWNEMQKHQPFGWVVDGIQNFQHIDFVYSCDPDNGYGVSLSWVETGMNFEHMLRDYKFADGTPFGIKEE